MKKALLILLLMPGVWSLNATGQISLNSGHLPQVGDTIHTARDTSVPGFIIGGAGPNQLWDYSFLDPDQVNTTYVVAPNTTPSGSSFPNATLAYTGDFSNYFYNKLTAAAFTVEGFASEIALGIPAVVELTNTFDQYRFSIDYLDSYTDDYAFTEAVQFDDLPIELQNFIDSLIIIPLVSVTQIRVIFNGSFTHTVDAWGTVITPLGSYDCLRQRRDETSTTDIDVEIEDLFGSKSWIDITEIDASITSYEWLTEVTKFPVVTLEQDSNAIITAVNYSMIPGNQDCNELTVSTGWNMISSNTLPVEPDMDSIISDATAEITLIKDGSGQVVFPLFGINQIGNWNVLEGYQVKASSGVTLPLGCTETDPATPVALSDGWSLISYLKKQPLNAAIALASLDSTLILAKNAQGQVYFPLFGINDIVNMVPGQGYQVKLSGEDTLIYPVD